MCRPPERSQRGGGQNGFTMVELMLVVVILGVIGAVALPAFSRYVRKARTAEAVEALEKMWAGSVSYYHTERVNLAGAAIPKQFPNTFTPGLPRCGCRPGGKCSGATIPPVTLQALGGYKMSAYVYQSGYTSSGSDKTAQFTAEQIGDLDCDTILSRFIRTGVVDANGDISGNMTPMVLNELE